MAETTVSKSGTWAGACLLKMALHGLALPWVSHLLEGSQCSHKKTLLFRDECQIMVVGDLGT